MIDSARCVFDTRSFYKYKQLFSPKFSYERYFLFPINIILSHFLRDKHQHSSRDKETMAKEASSSSTTTKLISLKAADGIVFEVEPYIAKEMKIVQTFIDDDAATATTTIPLPNVYSHELDRIVQYCRQHCIFRDAGTSAKKDAKDFNAEFVRVMSDEELKALLLAANYLNMNDLLEFLSQTIATRIQNKSVKFVRKFFGVVNDYTPEEEARFREENAWAFQGVEEDDEE